MVLIPINILQRKDISNLSKIIYGCLYYSHINEKEFLTIAQMIDLLSVSRQSISFCLGQLKNNNLISIYKDGVSNRYELIKNNEVNKDLHSKDNVTINEVIDLHSKDNVTNEVVNKDLQNEVNEDLHSKDKIINKVNEDLHSKDNVTNEVDYFFQENNLSDYYKEAFIKKYNNDQTRMLSAIDFVNWKAEENYDIQLILNTLILTSKYDDSI